VRVAFGQPRVSGDVEMVDEKGATPLNRVHGDGRVTGAPADATKGLGLVGGGLCSDELTVGGATPKVGAAGMEEGASEGAEGPDEVAGIGALKGGPGKLQEKLLEGLVRLRRVAGTRFSGVGCQWRTNRLAKRLKTLGLHKNGTLDSQIESSEYEGQCRLMKRHQSDTRVSICNRKWAIVGICDASEMCAPGECLACGREGAKDRFFNALQTSLK